MHQTVPVVSRHHGPPCLPPGFPSHAHVPCCQGTNCVCKKRRPQCALHDGAFKVTLLVKEVNPPRYTSLIPGQAAPYLAVVLVTTTSRAR